MAKTIFKRPLSQKRSSKISGQSQDQTAEAIRKKAYELYAKRGSTPNRAMDDWLEAERIIKQRVF